MVGNPKGQRPLDALRRERNSYAAGRIFGGELKNIPVGYFSRGPLLQEKRGPAPFLMRLHRAHTENTAGIRAPLRAGMENGRRAHDMRPYRRHEKCIAM